MQIPKSLLIICMAALGVSSLHAQRADSDVQAKAREQLRQKLSDLNSQAPSNPAPAPETKPAAPAKVQEAAPQAEAKPAEAPVAAAPVTDSGKEVPVYSTLEPAEQTKALEALHQKMQTLNTQGASVTPAVATEPAQPKVAAQPKNTRVTKTANNDPSFAAATVAPAPAPNSKEAKLANLLQQYKADTITPVEYHTQRAKILSEP